MMKKNKNSKDKKLYNKHHFECLKKFYKTIFVIALVNLALPLIANTKGLNVPSAWKPKGTGKVTISTDEKENALLFKGDFSPKMNGFIFPGISIDGKDVSSIGFELKILKGSTSYGGKIILGKQKHHSGYFNFPVASAGIWKKIKVNINDPHLDRSKVHSIQIAIHSDKPVLFCLIKNITLFDNNGNEIKSFSK